MITTTTTPTTMGIRSDGELLRRCFGFLDGELLRRFLLVKVL